MQLQLHYTNYTTPQLQRHDPTTTTTAALHQTTSSSCGRCDRPGDHCNHCNHSKKYNSNQLFSPSVDSLCHPCFTTTKLSYRFPILKLPAPPCVVLLVLLISIFLLLITIILGDPLAFVFTTSAVDVPTQ